MSAANTVIKYGTRFRVNGVLFNATGGRVRFATETADVSDSESVQATRGRFRKAGIQEAEITIQGNLATDVNPALAPYQIAQSIVGGTLVPLVEIFNSGFANNPDTFTNVFVDYFEKVPGGGGDMNQPNTFEFHGYTSVWVIGG